MFHVLRPRRFVHDRESGGGFKVFKPRSSVESYAALIEELQPQQILELGIDMGGSTVLLAELARPRKLVAVDLRLLEEVRAEIQDHAARTGLDGFVRTFGGIDQSDRMRLAQIVDEEFEDRALDLIIDDCSHAYEPTRASFSELFPRLRPGGKFVIEDWIWAHTPLGSDHPEGFVPGAEPLTRLLFEIQLAIPSVPGLVESVLIEEAAAIVTRGEAELNPTGFDIAECSNPPGRRLLDRNP